MLKTRHACFCEGFSKVLFRFDCPHFSVPEIIVKEAHFTQWFNTPHIHELSVYDESVKEIG
jgi:hypothetical protein